MLLAEALTWVAPITEVFIRYKYFGLHSGERLSGVCDG